MLYHMVQYILLTDFPVMQIPRPSPIFLPLPHLFLSFSIFPPPQFTLPPSLSSSSPATSRPILSKVGLSPARQRKSKRESDLVLCAHYINGALVFVSALTVIEREETVIACPKAKRGGETSRQQVCQLCSIRSPCLQIPQSSEKTSPEKIGLFNDVKRSLAFLETRFIGEKNYLNLYRNDICSQEEIFVV